MRKWIAGLLAIMMVCACMLPAMAEETAPNVMNAPEAGVYAKMPDAWMKMFEEGNLLMDIPTISEKDLAFAFDFYLVRDDAEEIPAELPENFDVQGWMDRNFIKLLTVSVLPLTIDAKATFVNGEVTDLGPDGEFGRYQVKYALPEDMSEQTKANADAFFAAFTPEVFTLKAPDADRLAEIREGMNTTGNRKIGADGMFDGFKVIDLAGNVVTSDIFKDAKLTLVNVWGTFCSPCLAEMPDLGALAAEYKDKGLQVVGIVCDVVNNGQIDTEMRDVAKNIVDKTGANYLHILPNDDVLDAIMRQVIAVPTTFFIDAEGKLVGEEIVSALSKEEWIREIDARLAK